MGQRLPTQGGTLWLLRLWGLVAEEALVDVIERDRPAARRDVKLDQIAHFFVEPKDGCAHHSSHLGCSQRDNSVNTLSMSSGDELGC